MFLEGTMDSIIIIICFSILGSIMMVCRGDIQRYIDSKSLCGPCD